MKKVLVSCLLLLTVLSLAQERDSIVYKKKVLEGVETDFLMSYYKQDGSHSAVGGGIGTEELTDVTPTIVVNIPLNENDVLTFDVGASIYTSASSSNINPFDASGASGGGDDDDDNSTEGSPWVESSGASEGDTWGGATISYSHSSDDRNKIWGAHISASTEFDYTSLGVGASYTRLFNNKNTEVSIKGQAYFDKWKIIPPTELKEYSDGNGNLNTGFFADATSIWREQLDGTISDIKASGYSGALYNPSSYTPITETKRNSYSLSLSLSQVWSKRFQTSIFMDFVKQDGLLSTPYQRVYFKDNDNYYIGNRSSISNYESPSNTDVFKLADDVERLPGTRTKYPVGVRAHYYLNDVITLRSYYRFYADDWGVNAHTLQIETPLKISPTITISPFYRYYTQTAADYFFEYETATAADQYYTSDYDLSKFNSSFYGAGLRIAPPLGIMKYRFGKKQRRLKSIDLRYGHYDRSDGLNSDIVSFGLSFGL